MHTQSSFLACPLFCLWSHLSLSLPLLQTIHPSLFLSPVSHFPLFHKSPFPLNSLPLFLSPLFSSPFLLVISISRVSPSPPLLLSLPIPASSLPSSPLPHPVSPPLISIFLSFFHTHRLNLSSLLFLPLYSFAYPFSLFPPVTSFRLAAPLHPSTLPFSHLLFFLSFTPIIHLSSSPAPPFFCSPHPFFLFFKILVNSSILPLNSIACLFLPSSSVLSTFPCSHVHSFHFSAPFLLFVPYPFLSFHHVVTIFFFSSAPDGFLFVSHHFSSPLSHFSSLHLLSLPSILSSTDIRLLCSPFHFHMSSPLSHHSHDFHHFYCPPLAIISRTLSLPSFSRLSSLSLSWIPPTHPLSPVYLSQFSTPFALLSSLSPGLSLHFFFLYPFSSCSPLFQSNHPLPISLHLSFFLFPPPPPTRLLPSIHPPPPPPPFFDPSKPSCHFGVTLCLPLPPPPSLAILISASSSLYLVFFPLLPSVILLQRSAPLPPNIPLLLSSQLSLPSVEHRPLQALLSSFFLLRPVHSSNYPSK